MFASALAYLAYRHPALTQPLVIALTGVGVFVAAASAVIVVNTR
ncbi:hypothetical protein [Streptomyces sp. NPDC059828]